MRLFIAVNIPDDIKERVAEVQSQLKASPFDIRWVEKEKFHLTLKFLGDVTDTLPDKVVDALMRVLPDFSPFDVSLQGVGAFPNIHRPRVVWAGVKEGKDTLCRLAQRVDEILQPLGFEKEKRGFSAHLTIGRVRSPQNLAELGKKLASIGDAELGSFRTASVDLMQSTLNSKGSQYQCLKSISI